MTQSLPLQKLISDEQTINYSYDVLTVPFGSGYTQSAPKGINNEKKELTIKYVNLTTKDFNTVINFLRGLKGSTSFFYTPHGDVQSKWRMQPESLATGVTAIHKTNKKLIYRSIEFRAVNSYD